MARIIESITVFTGASEGLSPGFKLMARSFGEELARRRITLVYGGGKVGLMGAVAEGALSHHGRVLGVMPKHLVDGEIAHPHLSELIVVDSMHERKQKMMELGDAFVALPGGAGTLDELFDAWTGQQLGVHDKPVALFSTTFWEPIVSGLQEMCRQGFVRQSDMDGLVISDDFCELVGELENWQRPAAKWS